MIESQRALGVSGVQLGASYEARLRLAIWSNDGPALDEYAGLVAREYRHGLGSVLGARYERLVEEVERSGLSSIVHFSELDRTAAPAVSTTTFELVDQQLRTASSDEERGERALGLLCEAFTAGALLSAVRA